MITGTPKITGIALAEMSVNFLSKGSPALNVKAAFINHQSGATHGWTSAGAASGGPIWSEQVLEKLSELQQLIEADLAHLHFSDVADPAEGGSGNGEQVGSATGLGEHLSAQVDAPPA